MRALGNDAIKAVKSNLETFFSYMAKMERRREGRGKGGKLPRVGYSGPLSPATFDHFCQ